MDVDNRFTVYGIRDLGTELSPITMLVMMESIQNRIVENGKRGKATWLYIDEPQSPWCRQNKGQAQGGTVKQADTRQEKRCFMEFKATPHNSRLTA